MVPSVLLCLGSPFTWWLLMMIIVVWSRMFHRSNGKRPNRSQIVRLGASSSAVVGSACLFLSTLYRPHHGFIAKAQVRHQEDAEDDDQGDLETPRRHLLRQLRRVRRGEKVDRLVLRLE
jgi:type VI protein secretion system component VasK